MLQLLGVPLEAAGGPEGAAAPRWTSGSARELHSLGWSAMTSSDSESNTNSDSDSSTQGSDPDSESEQSSNPLVGNGLGKL